MIYSAAKTGNSSCRFSGVLIVAHHCPEGDARWTNIQQAIHAAEDGWTIELCDATFAGLGNRNIDFHGKVLTLRSRSGNPENCIINCEGTNAWQLSRRAFVFDGDDGAPQICGITIFDGRGGLEGG
jgi:hypothetical protein